MMDIEDRSYRRCLDNRGREAVELPDGKVVQRIWSNFTNGKIPWETLDDDEISRLQLKRMDGTWNPGPKPRVVPISIAKTHAQALVQRNDKYTREVLLKTTQTFIDVLDDDMASHADKMKAAQYLQERVIGKVPDKVQMTAEVKPWEGLVEDILVDVDDEEGSTAGD